MNYFEQFFDEKAFDEDELVRIRIADTQGEIYQIAYERGYDMEFFSQVYLNTIFCRCEMDAVYSPYQYEMGEVCFELIDKELKEAGVTIPTDEDREDYDAFRVGRIYRYLFYELRRPSDQLSKIVDFKYLVLCEKELEDQEAETTAKIIVKRIIDREEEKNDKCIQE